MFSLVLTLYVIPAMYTYLASKKNSSLEEKPTAGDKASEETHETVLAEA